MWKAACLKTTDWAENKWQPIDRLKGLAIWDWCCLWGERRGDPASLLKCYVQPLTFYNIIWSGWGRAGIVFHCYCFMTGNTGDYFCQAFQELVMKLHLTVYTILLLWCTTQNGKWVLHLTAPVLPGNLLGRRTQGSSPELKNPVCTSWDPGFFRHTLSARSCSKGMCNSLEPGRHWTRSEVDKG